MTNPSPPARQPEPLSSSVYPPDASTPIYAFQPRIHPQGTTVLVLGVLSFFVGLCAPFAWYIGTKALSEIRGSGLRYDNEHEIVVGRLIGLVVSMIGIVGIVFGLVFLIITTITIAASS